MSAALERARKNWPPVRCASVCSVPALGGTRICSVKPPFSFAVTIPLGVPTSTVDTATCSRLAICAAACGDVRPPSRAPSESSSTETGGTVPSAAR